MMPQIWRIENFALWGELLIPANIMKNYIEKIDQVRNFGNSVISRFNTPAKLKNFDYTVEQLERIAEGIKTIEIVERCEAFKNSCSADKERAVKGRLEAIEDRLEQLKKEWTRVILTSIEDPLVRRDIQYLDAGQRKLIEEFLSKRELPDVVDDNFVDAVNTLLEGLDKVEVNAAELTEIMASWGPCTVDDIMKRFEGLVKDWSKGRDKSKLRIIVKK